MDFSLHQHVCRQRDIRIEAEGLRAFHGTKGIVGRQRILEDSEEDNNGKRTEEDEYGILC